MTLLILFFLFALGTSFMCSLWESVLLSITPSYVSRVNAEGSPIGKLLDEFKRDIDRPLSAILTLNTIAHTIGAIGVGAQASRLFGAGGAEILGVQIDYEAMVAAVTTLAILIFSEIIPKTLGANQWERLTPFTVRSLRLLVLVLWPLVWMSQVITVTLKKDKDAPVFSRAEFQAMADVGHKEGELNEDEAAVIHNLLRMREIRVQDVMTPRPVVFAIEREQTVDAFVAAHPSCRFSRLPTYAEDLDAVHGVVLKDHLLAAAAGGEGGRLVREFESEAVIVSEDLALPVLMKRLAAVPQQLAVVVDEYGVTAGVITLEDALETLLGMEIIDEQDEVVDLRRLARERWQERRKRLGLE